MNFCYQRSIFVIRKFFTEEKGKSLRHEVSRIVALFSVSALAGALVISFRLTRHLLGEHDRTAGALEKLLDDEIAAILASDTDKAAIV